MRIVLDTGILISALITKNTPPDLLYQHWIHRKFLLITSYEQLEELERVFTYPKLKKFINTNEAQIMLAGLEKTALIAEDLPEINLSSDATDNLIIATAIASKADFLITGDKKHLLSIKKAEDVRIITAREAIKLF